MKGTHYEVLGLNREADEGEIKQAYRKLVRLCHPDIDPTKAPLFLQVQEAYEVLSDPDRRAPYDLLLQVEAERVRAAAYQPRRPVNPNPPTERRTSKVSTAEISRLTVLFARGRHNEAERLAREIVKADSRQPLPYAILGDLARAKGNMTEAAKMYAYAVQMDPTNMLFMQRHEEMLKSVHRARQEVQVAHAKDLRVLAPMTGAFSVVVMASYLALSHESAVLQGVAPISSWTLGLIVMGLLGGIVVGASLSCGALLDRFNSLSNSSTGKPSPSVTLGAVAMINFWAAAVLYFLLGAAFKAYNYSTSRLMAGCVAAVTLLTLGAFFSPSLNAPQVFWFGGNLVYVGSIVGWMVADSFRR